VLQGSTLKQDLQAKKETKSLRQTSLCMLVDISVVTKG
jgi:hypothetical protein